MRLGEIRWIKSTWNKICVSTYVDVRMSARDVDNECAKDDMRLGDGPVPMFLLWRFMESRQTILGDFAMILKRLFSLQIV